MMMMLHANTIVNNFVAFILIHSILCVHHFEDGEVTMLVRKHVWLFYIQPLFLVLAYKVSKVSKLHLKQWSHPDRKVDFYLISVVIKLKYYLRIQMISLGLTCYQVKINFPVGMHAQSSYFF
jgi:hypothetical protein